MQSDDPTSFNYRPSNSMASGYNGTATRSRDFDICVGPDGATYLLSSGGPVAVQAQGFYLRKFAADNFNTAVFTAQISTSALGANTAYAPDFTANQDGSMYVDAYGLPVVTFHSGTSTSTKIGTQSSLPMLIGQCRRARRGKLP